MLITASFSDGLAAGGLRIMAAAVNIFLVLAPPIPRAWLLSLCQFGHCYILPKGHTDNKGVQRFTANFPSVYDIY